MPSLAQQHSGNQKRREWVSPPPTKARIDEEAQESDHSEESPNCCQNAIAPKRSTAQLRSETDFPVGQRGKDADRNDRDTHPNSRRTRFGVCEERTGRLSRNVESCCQKRDTNVACRFLFGLLTRLVAASLLPEPEQCDGCG